MSAALLTAMGVAGGLGAVAKGAQGMYGAAQQFTNEDRDRLRQLERLRALDQLGMSESERSTLERQLLNPISSAQREGQSELLEAMSIQDVGAANTARQMQALSSVAGEQKAQAMEQVQEAERFREAQQRADISALEYQRRARRVGMATAGLGAAADLAGVAVQHQKAKLDAANQKAMMQLLQANQESADQSTQYLDEATANQLLMLKLLGK